MIVNSQESYESALKHVERIAERVASKAGSLGMNSDFMLFGDSAMDEHVAKLEALRDSALLMARLLDRVAHFGAAEAMEAQKVPSAERLAQMGGI